MTEQKAALERLRPSEKADHKTVLEEQGLKREVCTDGTRVKILEDITNWANDRSFASPHVFWLTGQAGSGKTTIAYTIAKRFEERDNANDQHTTLGGNFLCSRQFQETQAQTRILPTIAYQLAHKCSSYANALYVADKFDTVNHDVSSQMRGLLVGPWQLSEATRLPELPPYLIVIDALDEIMGDGGSAFLRDLLIAINEYDLKGLKFLVTSRSDPKVAALCESFASEAVCRLQDVPIEEAKSDIETYLKTQLPELAGSPEFAELGQRAGGLFIYAATAVKYLTPLSSITVGEQTEMLNDFLSKSYEPASSSTSLVDELYRQIMYDTFSKLSGKVLARRLCTLYTFLCTAERTSASVVAALVLDGDEEAARAVLRDLHAVLYTQDDRVFWYHGSFPDFIFTQSRSNFRIDKEDFSFSCNKPAHHGLLGESCFSIMKSEKSGLRFNMGNIMSSFLFDRDITAALSEQVNQNITAVLRYSCRHWTHHLPPQLINIDNLCRCISEFLQVRVLFWIEAMNLLGLSNQCTPMLQFASQWVMKVRIVRFYLYFHLNALYQCENSYSKLAHDIGEAANFATYFTASPAAESTPHLYISALATWWQDTSLSRNWKRQFARIPVFTYARGSIDLPLMTISTGGRIKGVAFSSDGMRSVSGSDDWTVRVWDASTGVELMELNGHAKPVSSVAFSSDGMRIVSGSGDNSVWVWDASTGVVLKMLRGHTRWVTSVMFSSDGLWVVSGSDDNSVRVWDASTGALLKKLNGHTSSVNSVAFSSDCTLIVSGSDDHSVRVWDVSTGVELKVLKGHSGSVKSVAFSSDGTWIVSGSVDHSVWVWDVSTGVGLKELKGHTSLVNSVAFSSDGTQIVSGSFDNSVRVWDVSTGVELRKLKGHTRSVKSVTFSSDGTRIVSGSNDNSLRVWDVSTCLELKELKGHAKTVNSVAFSSDGLQIVSGSDDNSVWVWDSSTGLELKELKGHTGPVNSVAFSCDGTWIVSGSDDTSVRLWGA